MKLKFRDDYPLDKIDLMQGEFRATWERSQQPFEVNDVLGETLLRTTYSYRIDLPSGKHTFEERLVFEQVTEIPANLTAPLKGNVKSGLVINDAARINRAG